jgi:CubicO group peptidase (beta-lactamase class C family)
VDGLVNFKIILQRGVIILKRKVSSKDTSNGTKNKRMIALKVLIGIAVCVGLAVSGVSIYGKYLMSKIPEMSFRECLEYTTKNNDDAVITVGIIKDGNTSYTVYGADGKELSQQLHTYEIGSVTKTFTAAMISKAVKDGKIDLNATIDQYITLPVGNDYPTVAKLLTHTSGYKSEYFEQPMISNFIHDRNDFFGITRDMIIRKAGKISLPDEYGFSYSNYGYAVLGIILENVYGEDYKVLMNRFLKTELKLSDTQISEQNGDLGKYWDWNDDDAYLSAGGITSNITDMLTYARMLLDKDEYLADCQTSLAAVNASTEEYKTLGINVDEIGMAWIIDKENNIIWHNGGTSDYNSYLGFDTESGTAVVVLSNLSPSYRIPATVLGVKVLKEVRGE